MDNSVVLEDDAKANMEVNVPEDAVESIDDLKSLNLKEISDLKNQLDEMRTRATIIETTKQDEYDELKFKTKQEIDSLNHIINALQSDMNSLRHDYEKLSETLKETRRQQQHSSSSPSIQSSPTPSAGGGLSRLNLSPFGSVHHHHHHHTQPPPTPSSASHVNISQENENLEEDMRKAKESADMLRSVVLPLETEINILRSRSNTNEQRVKELEKFIDDKEKERKSLEDEERRSVNESLNRLVDEDIETFKLATNSDNNNNKLADVYFNKYISLKRYLKANENKFIELEQTNIKSIKQIYELLNYEQKMRLVPKTRPKSKSITSNTASQNGVETTPNNNDTSGELIGEQNEIISKIEELLSFLTLNSSEFKESMSTALNLMNSDQSIPSSSAASSTTPLTYAEMLAMYEKEKTVRLDMETNFQQKAKDSVKQIEHLNRDITSMSTIIDELRRQYVSLQSQYQFQLDSLIKLNEEIRVDMHQTENRNEHLKSENLKLKAENKQLYGEQTSLGKELDEQYKHVPNSLEEATRQLNNLKADMIKAVMVNQALNKQLNLSSENIKHLTKVNSQYQRSNNTQDQLAITQSLESELERERKVRIESESDKQELLAQLKSIKEKSYAQIEALNQRIEQNEQELRKSKEENQELVNQIQSLKKDAKNSLSVQEDLVKLIQSLQIELNQIKVANDPYQSSSNGVDGSGRPSTVEVRCQHEDDFNECAACKSTFSVTKRKHRCKHCCKIFCADCSAKTIYSGPNLRPHKVCDSCHTLLDKHSTNTSRS